MSQSSAKQLSLNPGFLNFVEVVTAWMGPYMFTDIVSTLTDSTNQFYALFCPFSVAHSHQYYG